MAKRQKPRRRLVYTGRDTGLSVIVVDLDNPLQVIQAALILIDFSAHIFFQAGRQSPEVLGCGERIRDIYRELQGEGVL